MENSVIVVHVRADLKPLWRFWASMLLVMRPADGLRWHRFFLDRIVRVEVSEVRNDADKAMQTPGGRQGI